MKNNEEALRGKCVVLGVCSSIAVYKAADLVSQLVKLGADVRVIMTQNAARLISPRIFQTLSLNQVSVDMWAEVADWKPEHVSLAQKADVFLVAPATANTIANFANGLAPDMLSSTYLATKGKVLIAPAMNGDMYAHPAVRENIAKLLSRGANIIEPDCGRLACGDVQKGKLAAVETIVKAVESAMK